MQCSCGALLGDPTAGEDVFDDGASKVLATLPLGAANTWMSRADVERMVEG